MPLVRALAVGALSGGLVLLAHLTLLLPPAVLDLAFWTGAVAAATMLVLQALLQIPRLPVLLSTPERVQRALRAGLPILRDHWRGRPTFDASWRWEEDRLVPLGRNDLGATSPQDADSAHARLAEGEALRRALAPAAPHLRAIRAAAGGAVIVKVTWEPGKTYLGQHHPELVQISVGPETLPWKDRRWGTIYNLTVSTDSPQT